jgi:hypothetical protein
MVTGTDIQAVTQTEHGHLISLIEKLIEAIISLPDDVQWGETSYMEDMEILNFVRIQTLSLQNARDNALEGYYRDTFHLIRMIFEAYFILRLISMCDKYPFRIKIRRGAHDPSFEHAKNRTIREAQRVFGSRLVRTYMENRNTLVVVLHGIPVVDDQGQDTGVLVPYNLCLNGVLNKKLSTRVLVHYNFLSNFSHSTSDSISLVSRHRITEIKPGGLSIIYNHYSSELALLYICHLLSMHLQHAMSYLRWRSIKLRNKKTYQSLCRKVEDDFGYFWFIFNKPHQYDRYTQANRKCNYRRQIFYRPEDIRMGDVRYYEDPLNRLKQLHQSQNELTSHNSYISPFPRNDVF